MTGPISYRPGDSLEDHRERLALKLERMPAQGYDLERVRECWFLHIHPKYADRLKEWFLAEVSKLERSTLE